MNSYQSAREWKNKLGCELQGRGTIRPCNLKGVSGPAYDIAPAYDIDGFYFSRHFYNSGIGSKTVGDRNLNPFIIYVEMSGALHRQGPRTSRQPEVTEN